jgi:predicted DNA-binding transcriptional regulator AlpA
VDTIIEGLKKLADRLPSNQIPALLAGLGGLVITLSARSVQEGASQPEQNSQGDRLLSVDEAAYKLGCTKDRLYRHPREFKFFEVRVGKYLRFSEKGIEKYISRMSRTNLD